MTISEPHFTAKQLAGLPGMPSTVQNVNSKAKREGWPFQNRAGRGGGREYPLSGLPEETRNHLFNTMIATPPETVCSLPAVCTATAITIINKSALCDLKKWQRECMDARLYFMRLLEQAKATGRGGLERMLNNLEQRAKNGTLPQEAAIMAAKANKRSGNDQSSRTLLDVSWQRLYLNAERRGVHLPALFQVQPVV